MEKVKGFMEALPTAAAGQEAQVTRQIMAILEKASMEAQTCGNEFPQLGHRPPGTLQACADMAVEASVETQIADVFQELQDVMDVESDGESEAPTEASEEAKAARRAKKAEAKAARSQRIKDGKANLAKVMAKIGKR